MVNNEDGAPGGAPENEDRRDFLYLSTTAFTAVGLAAAMWPLIDSLNPAADVLGLSTAEFDLAPIEPGQRITYKWRKQPLFVIRRTPGLIARAKADDDADLIDPEPDGARVQREEWLIVVGVCTHLGCIPLGQRERDERGRFGGWFCACHGSLYDVSGRVRRGPAPKNLVVPPYTFLDGDRVRVG